MANRTFLTLLATTALTFVASPASAALLPLTNPTFMPTVQGAEEANFGANVAGWTSTGNVKHYSLNLDGDNNPAANSGGQARIWPNWFAGLAFNNMGAQGAGTVQQLTTHTYLPNTTYTFSVYEGSGFEGYNSDVSLQLLANGSTVVANNTFLATRDTLAATLQSVIFDTATNPAIVGQTIGLKFDFPGTASSGDFGGAASQLYNVTLDAQGAPVPEPSTLVLCGLAGTLCLVARRRALRRQGVCS